MEAGSCSSSRQVVSGKAVQSTGGRTAYWMEKEFQQALAYNCRKTTVFYIQVEDIHINSTKNPLD